MEFTNEILDTMAMAERNDEVTFYWKDSESGVVEEFHMQDSEDHNYLAIFEADKFWCPIDNLHPNEIVAKSRITHLTDTLITWLSNR